MEGVDITELKTFFTGDVSDLQAKAQQAQQIAAQTATAMTASLRGAGNGFADIGKPLAGVTSQFQNFGNTVSTTFNQVGNEFQKLPTKAKPPLDEVAQAFKQLGIKSQESLQSQATAAQKAFNTISLSGKSSAEDIIRAQKAVDAALSKTQSELQKTGQAFQTAESRTKSFADKMQSVRQVTQQVGTAMVMGGAAMSAAFTVPFAAAINAGRDFETAFAGVRKTVKASESELATLRQSFRDLSKEMPTTAAEFAKIGEAAGQLGVKQKDILQFSKVMADLGVTTNLTSDQAATALARFANIIDNQAGPQFDRLGATIVALGNAGASTESEIVEMALRIAGAGKQAGLSESDILAFANALSSVGIEAEAGGSSMSRLLINISDATKLGGKELQIFAQVAGQSAAEFKRAFQEDAGKATVSFIEGLGRISASGKSLTPTLEALGLSNIRVSDALLRASGAGDLFRESLELGSKAWQENTALTKEAEERYKTFDSQLQIVKNRLTDIGITLFDELRPTLIKITDGLKSMTEGFTSMDPQARKLIATLLAGLAVAGPIALGIGAIVVLLGGPLAIALVAVTAGISVLFAESVAGSKRGAGEMLNFKDTLLQTASAFGTVLDIVGVVANGFSILAKAIAFIVSPIILVIELLRGNFTTAWETYTNTVNNLINGINDNFSNMTQDINGRWSNTLNGMVQNSFKAVGGFGEAGQAAGIAYSQGLEAGISGADKSSVLGFTAIFSATKKQLEQEGREAGAVYAREMESAISIGGIKVESVIAQQSRTRQEEAKQRLAGITAAREKELGVAALGLEQYEKMVKEKTISIAKAGHPTGRALIDGVTTGITSGIGGAKGAAASASKAVINEFHEGAAGIAKAFDVVTRALATGTFTKLFDDLPAKARKGLDGIKQAAEVVVKELNDLLGRMSLGGTLVFNLDDKALKPTIASLEALGATGVAQFKRVSEAAKIVEEELTKIRLGAISFKGQVFEIPFLALYDSMGKVTAGGERMREAISKAGGTIKVTFADISKVVSESAIKQIDAMNTTTDTVEEWSRQWVKSLENAEIAIAPLPPGIDTLRAAVQKLKDDIAKSRLFEGMKLKDETARAMEGVVAIFQREGERLGETQDQINRRVLAGMAKFKTQLPPEMQAAADLVVDAFKRGIDRLPGLLDDIFNKIGPKAKGFAHDIIGIFDTMPGKWGESLRKGLDEINKWISFLDSAIKLVQRILGDDQTGLAGMIGSVFKKTATVVEESTHSIGGSLANVTADAGVGLDQLGTQLQKSGKEAQDTAGKWVAAIGAVVSGIAMFVGTRHQGLGRGIMGGAMAGFTMGATIGSILPGIGTLIGGGIGALIGGIAGIFGSGKSEAQKQAEATAAENAKMSMQQTAQNIVNSALEGFSRGLDFLEKLDEFTAPRKEKFRKFFAAFTRLLNYFVELSKSWSATSFAQVKAAGEAIGPIADAISRLPEAFDAINGHFSVAQASIDKFFADFDTVMNAFFVRSEVWIDGISKRAMKVANRLTPVVSLISGFAAAITDVGKVVEPDQSIWGIFDRTIENIVSHVAALADKFDKAVLKTMANFAEKSGGALNLWKEAVDAIKSMVDIPMPSDADFANVFNGVERIILGMTGLAERLSADGIAKAASLATASLAIFSSIKAGVEAMASLKDLQGTLPETFDAFYRDFNHAVTLLESMATRAIAFETVSKVFEQYIASGAMHLSHAFEMLSQIVNAAGSFFPEGPIFFPQEGAAASAPLSRGLAVSSFAPLSVSESRGQSSTVILNINAGTVVHESQLPDVMIRALEEARKRGMIAEGVLA